MTSNFLNEMIKKRVTAFFIVISSIVGYGITAFSVLVGLFHEIPSPSVVNFGIGSGLMVPVLALITHVYNKKMMRRDEKDNNNS